MYGGVSFRGVLENFGFYDHEGGRSVMKARSMKSTPRATPKKHGSASTPSAAAATKDTSAGSQDTSAGSQATTGDAAQKARSHSKHALPKLKLTTPSERRPKTKEVAFA